MEPAPHRTFPKRQLTLPWATKARPSSPGPVQPREGTEYVELACRSVLNWVEGRRLSDFYSANPYRGCEFGCVYCYARYTHEFLDESAVEDFERRVYVKANAPQALARDLLHARRLDCGVHFGSATDPYQPAEGRFGITRRMLEKLLPHRGIPITIATKGAQRVERDADLLVELSRRHPVKVVMTCVTLDPVLQRALEPQAPSTERRLAALAALSARGIPTGLLLAPVMPGLNDGEQELAELCRRARQAGVSSMMSQVLFLPAASKRRFFPWLKAARPDLFERYLDGYRGGRELGGELRRQIEARIAAARDKAGLGSTRVDAVLSIGHQDSDHPEPSSRCQAVRAESSIRDQDGVHLGSTGGL